MLGRIMIALAGAGAALAVAVTPALATSDPATAVRDDVVQLGNAVRTAESTLLPDLATLKSDLKRRNAAAVKHDVTKIRSDTKLVLPAIEKRRKQLISDLSAARAVGADLSTTGASGSSSPLTQFRDLQHQLRTGLQASRSTTTTKKKTPHAKHVKATKPARVKHAHAAQHAHTPKHAPFVKHSNTRTHPHKNVGTHKTTHPHKGASTHKKKK